MRELLLNVLIILGGGLPLLLLHVYRDHFKWLQRRYTAVSVAVWLILCAVLWGFVLPHFGLRWNPRVIP